MDYRETNFKHRQLMQMVVFNFEGMQKEILRTKLFCDLSSLHFYKSHTSFIYDQIFSYIILYVIIFSY